MSTDKLLYDGDYWKTVLENDIKTKSLDEKLHLIFTLVIFLQISIAQLLNFIFTSRIKEVQNRAARFLGHTPTATSEDKAFPAGMIFRAWHENFPKAKKNLHKMVQPCAVEMVLEESDKLIGDKELQVNMKDLTLRSIQTLLQPEAIANKYRLLAPFTWNLLETISASPNKYRKYNLKTTFFENDHEKNDDWNDDPNADDEDPERKWNDFTSEGFSRNPVLVSPGTPLKVDVLLH